MDKSKTQSVFSLLKKYLKSDEAEQLVLPIMQGIPVLIDGIQGPTGKSTLCKGLNELGVTAYECWEVKKTELFKKDNDNTVYIIIVLNEFVM